MRRSGVPVIFLMISCLLFCIATAMAEESAYQDKKTMVKNLVDEAVKVINTEGEAGVKSIADPNGRFNTKESYVFITSESGADLINPAFKDIEGMPPELYANPAFKAAQEAIVNAVKDRNEAWVEYPWPRPGETRPSKKISYLKKIVVNGKVRIVGAGFYPAE